MNSLFRRPSRADWFYSCISVARRHFSTGGPGKPTRALTPVRSSMPIHLEAEAGWLFRYMPAFRSCEADVFEPGVVDRLTATVQQRKQFLVDNSFAPIENSILSGAMAAQTVRPFPLSPYGPFCDYPSLEAPFNVALYLLGPGADHALAAPITLQSSRVAKAWFAPYGWVGRELGCSPSTAWTRISASDAFLTNRALFAQGFWPYFTAEEGPDSIFWALALDMAVFAPKLATNVLVPRYLSHFFPAVAGASGVLDQDPYGEFYEWNRNASQNAMIRLGMMRPEDAKRGAPWEAPAQTALRNIVLANLPSSPEGALFKLTDSEDLNPFPFYDRSWLRWAFRRVRSSGYLSYPLYTPLFNNLRRPGLPKWYDYGLAGLEQLAGALLAWEEFDAHCRRLLLQVEEEENYHARPGSTTLFNRDRARNNLSAVLVDQTGQACALPCFSMGEWDRSRNKDWFCWDPCVDLGEKGPTPQIPLRLPFPLARSVIDELLTPLARILFGAVLDPQSLNRWRDYYRAKALWMTPLDYERNNPETFSPKRGLYYGYFPRHHYFFSTAYRPGTDGDSDGEYLKGSLGAEIRQSNMGDGREFNSLRDHIIEGGIIWPQRQYRNFPAVNFWYSLDDRLGDDSSAEEIAGATFVFDSYWNPENNSRN